MCAERRWATQEQHYSLPDYICERIPHNARLDYPNACRNILCIIYMEHRRVYIPTPYHYMYVSDVWRRHVDSHWCLHYSLPTQCRRLTEASFTRARNFEINIIITHMECKDFIFLNWGLRFLLTILFIVMVMCTRVTWDDNVYVYDKHTFLLIMKF